VSQRRSRSMMGEVGALRADVSGISVQELTAERSSLYLVCCSAVSSARGAGLQFGADRARGFLTGPVDSSSAGIPSSPPAVFESIVFSGAVVSATEDFSLRICSWLSTGAGAGSATSVDMIRNI